MIKNEVIAGKQRVVVNFNSLQASFKPFGVKKQWNEDGNDIVFTHDVMSWKSYKQGEI